MIYEMRIYRCVPGRLPALLKRFETVTLKVWEKHGIKQDAGNQLIPWIKLQVDRTPCLLDPNT